MSSALSATVAVCTLNRGRPLCRTIDSLLAADGHPFEIIIVDQSDAHPPEIEAYLRSVADRVDLVRPDFKQLTRARNLAIKRAHGEIVIFVDDDVVVDRAFVSGHLDAYRDPSVVGVTGPAPLPNESLKTRGDIGEDAYQQLLCRESMRFDVDFPFSANFAVGANMSFRRSLLLELGGFDEVFVGMALGEDAELSHRAKKRGTIWYAPQARLTHYMEPSGGCRDARSEQEYIRQYAFCTTYFWHRVEARPHKHAWAVLQALRGQVRKASSASVARRVHAFARGTLQGLRAISRTQ